jgi:hypothetical protein
MRPSGRVGSICLYAKQGSGLVGAICEGGGYFQTWSKCGKSLKSLAAVQINARSPNYAPASPIMVTVSTGDSTCMLPKPKYIGGVPAAIQDATSSSASVGNSIGSADKKPAPTPFGSQPGKAQLVVSLNLQRPAVRHPSRRAA